MPSYRVTGPFTVPLSTDRNSVGHDGLRGIRRMPAGVWRGVRWNVHGFGCQLPDAAAHVPVPLNRGPARAGPCASTTGGRLVKARQVLLVVVRRTASEAQAVRRDAQPARGTACAEGCIAKRGRNRTGGLPERRARRELSAALGGPKRKLGIMGLAPPPPRTGYGGFRRRRWRPPRVSGFRRTDR